MFLLLVTWTSPYREGTTEYHLPSDKMLNQSKWLLCWTTVMDQTGLKLLFCLSSCYPIQANKHLELYHFNRTLCQLIFSKCCICLVFRENTFFLRWCRCHRQSFHLSCWSGLTVRNCGSCSRFAKTCLRWTLCPWFLARPESCSADSVERHSAGSA